MPPKLSIRGLPAARRLKAPREFAALIDADRARSIRLARRWLAVTAMWTPAAPSQVRFGFTVGKRSAKRSVDRMRIKRIARESARHAAAALQLWCDGAGLSLDVVLRLKAPVPIPGKPPTLAKFKRELRLEADELFSALSRRLPANATAAALDSK